MDLQNRAEAGSDGHDESVLNPEKIGRAHV